MLQDFIFVKILFIFLKNRNIARNNRRERAKNSFHANDLILFRNYIH